MRELMDNTIVLAKELQPTCETEEEVQHMNFIISDIENQKRELQRVFEHELRIILQRGRI